MQSSFWWGIKIEEFLFKNFGVNSKGGLFGLCLIVFSMAFLFEYLRYVQVKHKQKELSLRVKQLKLLCPTESATLLARTVTNLQNPLNITIFDRCKSKFLLFKITKKFLELLCLQLKYPFGCFCKLWDIF